jgi:hypothetical protein
MKRDAVDFHMVPESQLAMHGRLENWAHSLFSSTGSNASPMFRLFRSTDVHATPHVSMPFDSHDAAKIAKGVRDLPVKNRAAINWFYVTTGAPGRACRSIGCTMAELAQLAIDGRAMLVNRRV